MRSSFLHIGTVVGWKERVRSFLSAELIFRAIAGDFRSGFLKKY